MVFKNMGGQVGTEKGQKVKASFNEKNFKMFPYVFMKYSFSH